MSVAVRAAWNSSDSSCPGTCLQSRRIIRSSEVMARVGRAQDLLLPPPTATPAGLLAGPAAESRDSSHVVAELDAIQSGEEQRRGIRGRPDQTQNAARGIPRPRGEALGSSMVAE